MNDENDHIILKGKTRKVAPNVYEAFGDITATVRTKYYTTIFNLLCPRENKTLCRFKGPAELDSN